MRVGQKVTLWVGRPKVYWMDNYAFFSDHELMLNDAGSLIPDNKSARGSILRLMGIDLEPGEVTRISVTLEGVDDE